MISVCVPYWARQDALDQMTASYARLYAGLDLEIVVADDGSPTPAVVPDHVRLVRLPTKFGPLNPCVPINVSVAASSGDVIVLTNPEVEHEDRTLDRMLELLEGPDDYVTARCWDTRGFWVAGEEVSYSERGRLPVPPGAHFHFCAILHRSLWEKAGGFDEEYRHVQGCDDNDWLWRLWRVGARFRTCESTVIHHAGKPLRWGLPHGRDLFMSKWGDEIWRLGLA